DVRTSPRVLVGDEIVVVAALRQGLVGLFGGEDPRQDCVVRPLDPREIEQPRGAADERAARKGQLRDRLPTAAADRSCAVGETLAACEGLRDLRVGLEPLEFVKWRERRVRIVEMNDEADRHQTVAAVIGTAWRLGVSGRNRCLRERIVGGLESLSEAGAERAV